MRDEFVETGSGQEFFEVVEEGEAFLVGDAGEGVVRVFASEIDHQFREFVVLAELGDGVRQGFPANYGGEVAERFAVSVRLGLVLRRKMLQMFL